MTLLHQALTKTFLRSEPCSPTTDAQPRVDGPHVAASPAARPGRAAADVAVAPVIPSVNRSSSEQPSGGVQISTAGEWHPQPTAAQPSTPPVGPSVVALLDEAFRASALGPSVATLLHEARQASTVTAHGASVAEPLAVALLDEAFHVKQVGIESPSPTRKTGTRRLRKVKRVAPETPSPTQTGKTETTETEADKTEAGKTETDTTETSKAEIDNAITASPEASATSEAVATTSPTHAVAVAPSPDATPWRPLLQVDGVVWRGIHDRLQTAAAAAIDHVTDRLLSLGESGSRVLGMASCASGEGVTTMVLAVARRLVNQGRKIAVVDANWSNPRLAQALCLFPEFGWEDAIRGDLPLAEIAIESLADGLTVVPARKPPARAIAGSRVADSLDILAREFEVVLVDLGPLREGEDEDSCPQDVVARMDAVILVQNVRVTTPNRLAEERRRLVASNVRLLGTIQNAVP